MDGYFSAKLLEAKVNNVTFERCGELCSIFSTCKSFEFCLLENGTCTSFKTLKPMEVGQCSLHRDLSINMNTTVSRRFCTKEGNSGIINSEYNKTI